MTGPPIPTPNNSVDEPEPPVGAGINFADPNSKLAPFYLTSGHVLAVLVIGFVASLSTFVPLWHTDVWAHLKYGEWMLDHKAIPVEEPFSPWWTGELPFTQFYTISHTVMALVFRAGVKLAGGDELNQIAGGIDALRTLHGLLQGLRLFFLWLAFRRVSGSLTTALSALVFVIIIDSVNIAVFRPQVFAQVYFAFLLYLVSGSFSWRWVLPLPLLMVIWANTHGSFIIALAFIALMLVGHVLERLQDLASLRKDRKFYGYLYALIASVLAIGVLNPYGFQYYSRTLALTSHSSLNLGVSEWQPLYFSWGMDWHWILIGSLLVFVITLYRSPRSCPPAHFLLILIIAGGMAVQQRFNIWLAMLLPWVLAPHWAVLQARVEGSEGESSPPTFRKTLLALAVAWSLTMWSTPVAWVRYNSPTPIGMGTSSGTPWEVAQVLQNKPCPGQPEWSTQLERIIQTNYPSGQFCGSVFGSPTKGEFLLWSLPSRIPVTYAHMHLFPPQFWAELGSVAAGQPNWPDVLERYGVNLVIFEPMICPQLIKELEKSSEWKIILDETDFKGKVIQETRTFIAIRLTPLRPTFVDVGGRR
jgi:hypothetical protein